MPFRAFAAVPLGPEPALVALSEALPAGELRVVDPGHLHITLSFLGDVPDDATPRLAAALDAAAAPVTPFTMRLAHVGAFPSARRPRVVWAGVEDPKPITHLALRVREHLAAAGFPGDSKDFRAHVTLARARGHTAGEATVRFLREHGRDELGECPVTEAVLFRSVLSPRGPSYEALHRAHLGATA